MSQTLRSGPQVGFAQLRILMSISDMPEIKAVSKDEETFMRPLEFALVLRDAAFGGSSA